MSELKMVELSPVQLEIEPKTRLLLIKQGSNEVKLGRESVMAMRKLREGKYESGVYTSSLVPRNRFTVAENGTISIVCKDDFESNAVVVANHKKLDDLKRIEEFVNKNKGRIAWEREFKGRY
jgi:hypothetical protein